MQKMITQNNLFKNFLNKLMKLLINKEINLTLNYLDN